MACRTLFFCFAMLFTGSGCVASASRPEGNTNLGDCDLAFRECTDDEDGGQGLWEFACYGSDAGPVTPPPGSGCIAVSPDWLGHTALCCPPTVLSGAGE
jgi:hypothetical protein